MTPTRASLRRLAARVLASAIMAASVFPLLATGVGAQDAAEPLTVYSGRSESLVGPIIERFTAETGLDVDVRYGDTAELAAVLLEEGQRSPADLFFAQDGGALSAVAAAGLLAPLDTGLLERVPAEFRDSDGRWVGVSGRARTVAYTTEEEVVLPDSILGFTDPAWAGRIGWVPGNGSFQAFVTALRVVEGEEAARSWLDGILSNEPVVYDSNASAVEGVAAGEVDVAFVNHYYLLQLIAEHGPDYPVGQHFFGAGDVGSLVNVAGLGELATTDQPGGAAAFIDFMLAEEAQRYFAEQSFEYPLIADISADPRLPALTSLESPAIDLSDLADLQGTVEMLRDVGAID